MGASTPTSKLLVPLGALAALALAAWAWFGPLPFLDKPSPWRPPPINVSGERPAAVGSQRDAEFTSLADALGRIRTPERAEVEPEQQTEPPIEEDPPPPPAVDPIADWRYSGYMGPLKKLVAFITLPDQSQRAVTEGDMVEGDARVVDVSPIRVVLEIGGERRSLTLVGLDPVVIEASATSDTDDTGAANGAAKRRPTLGNRPMMTPLTSGSERPRVTPNRDGIDDNDGDTTRRERDESRRAAPRPPGARG